MARPCKCRKVSYLPSVIVFKPVCMSTIEQEVSLAFEEVEAIRLKDQEGLDQETSAERMNISRPTFQRILVAARRKLADVILNGKTLRIEGGNFEVNFGRFYCKDGHDWDVPAEELASNTQLKCPICHSPGISLSSTPCSTFARYVRCCEKDLGVAQS